MCYNRKMDGGVTELESIWEEDELLDSQPPSDDAMEEILRAVNEPNFMPWLLAYILRQSQGHQRALFLGYSMGKNLPGGMCVESLAHALLERILLGRRPWDQARYPNFLLFCKMHAKSMVSNLFNLSDTLRRKSVSPVEEADEEGNPIPNQILDHHLPQEDGRKVQGRDEFNRVANDFLTDLALKLQDNSTEQKIVMEIIDNKDVVKDPRDGSNELLAVDRPYMVKKLEVTEKAFDAAMKRLQRKHKDLLPVWLEENKLTADEIGGLLHG
jgi:hypothetical protein